MRNEIIVGVVTAIIVSGITYFATSVKTTFDDNQLRKIAKNISEDDNLSTTLLELLAKDPRFLPKEEDQRDVPAPGLGPVVKNGSNWCASLRNGHQICWGYQDLSIPNSNVREFDFKFAREFSALPTITNGVNANGSGASFSVYANQLTSSDYKGAIVEPHSRNSSTSVRMNYIAIGLFR